jgi:hypothetical protein
VADAHMSPLLRITTDADRPVRIVHGGMDIARATVIGAPDGSTTTIVPVTGRLLVGLLTTTRLRAVATTIRTAETSPRRPETRTPMDAPVSILLETTPRVRADILGSRTRASTNEAATGKYAFILPLYCGPTLTLDRFFPGF